MLVKPEAFQQVSVETWAKRENYGDPNEAIKPVRKKSGTDEVTNKTRQGTAQDAPSNAPADEVDPKEAKQAVHQVQSFLENLDIQLHFQEDKDTGDFVVQVKDGKTGKVIRQIPPEELLRLRGKLEEFKGILFNKKA